jgi:ribonucleotide reductase alpha subunit
MQPCIARPSFFYCQWIYKGFTSHDLTKVIACLADTFMALRMPFDSSAAKELDIQIFETIYHGALKASSEIAERNGPYETWMGSPAQLGQLQHDMWGVTPTGLWDWASLKERIARVTNWT